MAAEDLMVVTAGNCINEKHVFCTVSSKKNNVHGVKHTFVKFAVWLAVEASMVVTAENCQKKNML